MKTETKDKLTCFNAKLLHKCSEIETRCDELLVGARFDDLAISHHNHQRCMWQILHKIVSKLQ